MLSEFIQSYYGILIRSNIRDLVGMQRAKRAGLLHVISLWDVTDRPSLFNTLFSVAYTHFKSLAKCKFVLLFQSFEIITN